MVNWEQFETKNDGKETTAFEEMIYLLFCSKYDFKEGIFGYVNQPGIEKQPIKVGDECIGFQAKYYTGRLSEHTDDLINVIKTSKTKYPSLTKLEIYTNAEYGYAIENDGTIIKPKPQVKVEKHAKKYGIKLEWYVKSNLDVILENEENKRIYEKFFGKEKSFLDYIMELKN